MQFLRKRAANDDKGGKAKLQKLAVDDQHLGSWDQLCSWENATVLYTRRGLEQFSSAHPVGLASVPRCIYVTMDWEQKQWRVLWFLRNHLKLNIEGFMELTHRRNRDLILASDAAGYGVTQRKGLVVASDKYGPWQGCGFMKDINDTAED